MNTNLLARVQETAARRLCASSSSALLASLELSDTKVYEPYMRALFGTAAHFCTVVVLKSRTGLCERSAVGTLHRVQAEPSGEGLATTSRCCRCCWSYRGTSLIRNHPPYDPTVGLFLGSYDGPRVVGVSYERGDPVITNPSVEDALTTAHLLPPANS